MSRRRAGAPAVVAAAVLLALLTRPGPVAAQSPTADMQQYTDEVVRLVREVTVREKDTLGALQAAVARMALQIFGAPRPRARRWALTGPRARRPSRTSSPGSSPSCWRRRTFRKSTGWAV